MKTHIISTTADLRSAILSLDQQRASFLWKGTIFFLLLLGLHTVVFAQRLPVEDFLYAIQQQGATNWQLSYSRDAYMGSEQNRSVRQTMRLSPDRTFALERYGKLHTGVWSVDAEGSRLILVFTHVGGQPLREKTYQTDFLLEKYANRQMVLAQQGRHGRVEMVYQQTK